MNREIFDPVLQAPNPLNVSDEQKGYIKDILDKSSSDSRFAIKAYLAIMKVLLGENVTPILQTITPDNGAAGSLAVAVTINGQDFDSGAAVLQAGVPVNTNFENNTELNATLNLSGAQPGVLAISVRNSTGLTSNVMNFTVSEPIVVEDARFTDLSNDSGVNEVRDDTDAERVKRDEARFDEERSPNTQVLIDESVPSFTGGPTPTNDYEELQRRIARFNAESGLAATPSVHTDDTPSPNPFDGRDESVLPEYAANNPATNTPMSPEPINVQPEPSVEDGRNVPLLNDAGSMDKIEGGKG